MYKKESTTPEEMQERFIKRLRYMFDVTGIQYTDVADALYLNKSNFSKYLSGEYMPRRGTLQQIADYFHVNPVWLYGLSDSDEMPTPYIIKDVPVYHADGIGMTSDSSIPVKDTRVSLAFVAPDDSMISARICEGDVLLVSEKNVVGEGDIAVIETTEYGVVIRRVSHDSSRLVLRSENPKYPTIVCRNIKGDATLRGKVVGAIIEVK